MAKSTGFADYVVHDLMADIDGVTAKRMFGGRGVYKDGVMFAIISDDVLYFKVSDKMIDDFKKYDSKPFTYMRKGKKIALKSYWRLPDEIMEDKLKLEQCVLQATQG